MGGGSYSVDKSVSRSRSMGYHRKSTNEIFTKKSIDNLMNPKDVKIRESRDSDEHPNSLAIIMALDVTGSMGYIPHYLIKNGLTNIMGNIIERGEKDPQVLFMGIGDHLCDDAPLQVAQFESSDELLDKWLKDVYLESGGGGNGGESYALAWYFAGNNTSIDCHEKRKRKGYLFTIGDDAVHRTLNKNTLQGIMGKGEYTDYDAAELLKKAQEKYEVYHIHLTETGTGQQTNVIGSWKEIMGDHAIMVNNHEEISKIISNIIVKNTKVEKKDTKKENVTENKTEVDNNEKPEILL